jgi:hypothetical protein
MLDDEVESSHQESPQHPQECIPMNSSNGPIESINSICDGLGCSAKSTSKVPVHVGANASVVLLLCEKCKQLFFCPKRT